MAITPTVITPTVIIPTVMYHRVMYNKNQKASTFPNGSYPSAASMNTLEHRWTPLNTLEHPRDLWTHWDLKTFEIYKTFNTFIFKTFSPFNPTCLRCFLILDRKHCSPFRRPPLAAAKFVTSFHPGGSTRRWRGLWGTLKIAGPKSSGTLRIWEEGLFYMFVLFRVVGICEYQVFAIVFFFLSVVLFWVVLLFFSDWTCSKLGPNLN